MALAGQETAQSNPIDGAILRSIEPHRDARGSFSEVFCDHWGLGIAPAQWSLVRSEPRVLRGMHLHHDHDEYFSLVSGRALVALKDLRPDSPSYKVSARYELNAEEPSCLSFPRGVLHGWYFYEASIHLQAVSQSYSEYHPHDNLGCRWDDDELGIDWPDADPVLSDEARAFGRLRDLTSF